MPKRLVYIIDDDPVNDLIYEVYFKLRYEVVSFTSYEDCLKIIKDRRPDVVVCDLVLPSMNGWEGIKNIREVYPTMPIIIASALDSSIQKVKAEKEGYAFWTKGGKLSLLEKFITQTAESNVFRSDYGH